MPISAMRKLKFKVEVEILQLSRLSLSNLATNNWCTKYVTHNPVQKMTTAYTIGKRLRVHVHVCNLTATYYYVVYLLV